MSKYLISVDGGGTKTEISVLDTSDQSIAMFDYDGTNYHSIGIEVFEKRILEAFDEIFDAMSITKDDILGVVMGISGCDTLYDRKLIQPCIEKIGIAREKIGIAREKIFLCNDGELIMYSCAGLPGICVVAGTGSIAFGYDSADDTVRCGGWGNPLSDLGSGFWIGMQILREYIKYLDGQVPYIAIFDEIETHYGEKSNAEFMQKLSQGDKKYIAKAAKVVLDAATDGDPLCESIAKAAAFNLANMCTTIFGKLDTNDCEKVDVVMTGSVFKNATLKEMFREQCKAQTSFDKFDFVEMTKSPSESGLDFAKKLFRA
ncbi:MAG: BadF/BadG/BcrA/BcrD ATPase family protein [Clostridia bacterium]